MSYKEILCHRCLKPVFITFFSAAEYKKKKGIVTKYRGIHNACLTDKERKEVANQILSKMKDGGAVSQKTKKELTQRQPRKKYDKPIEIKGTREVYIKGKE